MPWCTRPAADYELLLRLDDKVPKKGAAKSAVDALETVTVQHGGAPDTCAICLEDQVPGDQVCRLPCDHGFHRTCIHRWLVGHKNSCPVCARPAC